MNELLTFMTAHLSFLWTGGRFRISEGYGDQGNALVIVASTSLEIQVIRDRGQIFIEVRPVSAPSTGNPNRKRYYPLNDICRLLGGDRCERLTCLEPERQAAFVRDHLDAIDLALAPSRWESTRAQLTEYARQRSAEMFRR